MMRDDIRYV